MRTFFRDICGLRSDAVSSAAKYNVLLSHSKTSNHSLKWS